MKLVKNLLHSIIPQEHAWKIALLTAWPSLVGRLATVATVEKIENSTLFIAVSHPAWAQELQALVPTLLTAISARFPDHRITTIKCAYRRAPRKASLVRERVATAPLALRPLSPQEMQLLASIPEAKLQSAFAAYFARCKALTGSKKS